MAEFWCSYAGKGAKRCPPWRCDCFIDTHPDDPFGLHPEDFVVTDEIAESDDGPDLDVISTPTLSNPEKVLRVPRKSLRDIARSRGISKDSSEFDVITGRRLTEED